ncbi:MAG TPA: TonB-dependent receptor [Lutibacter sp.]|nr:TonB-dependent receptor [Lutibacter sp.]
MKKTFLVNLLFLLFVSTIYAQNIDVSGKLIDIATGEPIVEATVKVAGTKVYTLTDFEGNFNLSTTKDVVLEVSHLQYKTIQVPVSNATRIEMTENSISLDEIIIKSDPLQDISHSVVVMDDIKKGSQSRNVTDLFNDIAGFNIQKRSASSTEPSLRAFKYEQMNIKYDGGIKIVNACPNRMDPITAHVIPEEVRKIEVVKGPFTVRFGQSFGGIVNMVTKKPTPEDYGWHGSLQSGYESNGGNFVGRGELMYATEKFDFIIDGERRDFGDYTDGEGVETSSGFETNSYSIKAGFNPKSNQRVQLDWRQKFANDIMHVGLAMDSPKDDSYMIALDYKIKNMTDKVSSLSVKSYYSFVDHLMTNGYASSEYVRPNYPATDARTPVWAKTIGGKFEIGIKPTKDWMIYTGLDADIIKRDGDKTVFINNNPNTGVPFEKPIVKNFSVWQDATIADYGVFAEVSYKLNKQYTATAGLRTDFVSGNMNDPDPEFEALYGGNIEDAFDITVGGNVALKYRDKGFQAQLAYGRGTRTPSMIERYIYRFYIGSDSREYIGNPYLKPEINNQIELSVNKKWSKIGIGVSTFYSLMENYITAFENAAFVGVGGGCGGGPALAPKQFWNVDANQYGFDAFFNYNIIEHLSFKSDIAYTKAYNETFDEPLAQVAPMSGHLGLKYETEEYWIDLRSELVATQSDFSTAFNEYETPGHTSFDLRLGYKPMEGLSIGGAVLNIFDKAYYNHLNFSFANADEFNGRKIYEVGRNFSLYIKYDF